MIELILIVAVIIIIWRLWISHTNKVRNEKQRPQMEEKERNAVAFINDVISVIDRSAPYFKYITMNCVSYDLDFGDIIIVNADNKVLKYNYTEHRFAPGNEAKKRLAIELATRYGGRWIENKRDISRDSQPCWQIVSYQVVAHEGLREAEEEKRRRESIRRC